MAVPDNSMVVPGNGMAAFPFSWAAEGGTDAENLSTGGAVTNHGGDGRRPPVTDWQRVGMFSINYENNYHKSFNVNNLYPC